MNAPTKKPIRKMYAVGIAGAISTIIIYAIPAFTGIELPSDVSVAITALIMFLVGYFIPSEENEFTIVKEKSVKK